MALHRVFSILKASISASFVQSIMFSPLGGHPFFFLSCPCLFHIMFVQFVQVCTIDSIITE